MRLAIIPDLTVKSGIIAVLTTVLLARGESVAVP
jgi:hypothetical protein